MEFNWTEIVLAAIAVLTPIVTHALDRRKHKAEVDQLKAEIEKTKSETMSSTVTGLGSAVDVYQDLVAGIKEEMAELRVSNTELRNKLAKVFTENDSLKDDLQTLNNSITQLNQYLCTVPCTNREVNPSVLNCVYLKDRAKAKDSVKTSKKKARNTDSKK